MPLLDQPIAALQDRTDAKLRYARIHLDELQALDALRGDDFERAHQESFLHHLLGAKDALLQEINQYYETGLAPSAVSPGSIRNGLKKRDERSDELAVLYQLEHDDKSWFCEAKAMRDQGTHVAAVRRTVFLGGDENGAVKLHNPVTGVLGADHYVDRLAVWLARMESLVQDLRTSALKRRARNVLLRSITDFEATLVEFQSNNVVLATTVLLRRLAEIQASANELGDPVLIAMVEKLHRRLTTGNGLDG